MTPAEGHRGRLASGPMQPGTRSPVQQLGAAARRVRRSVLARRRPLAALCATLAVLTTVQVVRAPASPTTPVLVAGHDLPGGRPLAAGDLVVRQYAVGTTPEGAVTDAGSVTGRVLAAPLRTGEPLTDVRLVGPDLLDGYPGTVVTPVRVADADAVRLVSVGDRVDLVGSDPESGETGVLAAAAPVVAVPRARGGQAGFESGALLVVAVSSAESLDLARAASSAVVSIALSR
jgi:Flp pilus assembly protein CpaB